MSSDGAVPVHFKVDDGNVGDPTTHIETWNLLRQLVGSPKFLYVADCKLCTSDNLHYIDEQHGGFITVLPSNRKEDEWFRTWVASHDAAWKLITCIEYPGPREPNVIEALESPIPEVNGFRLIWFRSSEKCRRDAEKRHDATVRAMKALEQLAEKLLKPRCRLKKIGSVRKAVEEILDQAGAKRWIDYKVEHAFVITDQHDEGRKRPGSPSKIRRTKQLKFYHGILAPSAAWRPLVVPESQACDASTHRDCPAGKPDAENAKKTGNCRPRNYSWAQLLRRVFELDILKCPRCGGRMRILAAINPPEAIHKILDCLDLPTRPPPIAPATSTAQPYFF